MRHWLTLATVAFFMVLLSVPAPAENQEDGCSENWSRWRQAFATLNENAGDLRAIKREPITPEIERVLQEKKGRLGMARIVHSVLEDRRQKMGSAADKLREATDLESAAFSALRSCLGRKELAKASQSDPDLIERKGLVSSLPDLLLEEAYAQYSRDRGRVATGGSRGYGRNPYGPSRFGYDPGRYYRGGTPPGYPQYR